jgi:hypothetical protein
MLFSDGGNKDNNNSFKQKLKWDNPNELCNLCIDNKHVHELILWHTGYWMSVSLILK